MKDYKETFALESICLQNVKCFKGKHQIDFVDQEGKPALWTVILGNNNTGKTTLLRLLAKKNILLISDKPRDDSTLWEDHAEIEELMKVAGDNHNISCFALNGFKGEVGSIESFVPIGLITFYMSSSNFIDKYTSPRSDEDNNVNSNQITKRYIDAYGVSRLTSETTLSDYSKYDDTTKTLFFNNQELTNVEEWLLQLDYAKKSEVIGADKRLEQLVNTLTSKILPDIESVKFETSKDFKSFALFKTPYGWIPLEGLSHGYRTTMTWVVDLAKRMFDRYPELDNPLHGPAIVLVDEIDLHLHPEWQRKIIKYLSDLFPNTQFIVTAHSPLIVQSAENVNLIMLEKDDETGSINVRQQFGSFQGWTVEEILRELMDMGEKTRSDRFLKLLEQFEQGLNEENYEKAKAAYDELDSILHPASSQRKLLSIQLSSLVPA
ncbi:AAA family ATPase [Spirosoma montaniterrae]|uniref:ATPase AAA-type core domain-containing protein n=1 Tax=Spirosoma montaniterrae TaxID=1178516 RepID=A0A1P9X0V3_9BACT|nr:AAA family ATPase [Spirosoma montaniterrae]AQG81228.1 hypothetical protein AWR27_19025 [Spirosoma montaniterrae]